MYECQGTLVRRGRGECVLARCLGWMCMFSFAGWGVLHVKMLSGCTSVSLRPGSSLPLCHLSGRNKWSLDIEMTKRCTERTEWEGSGIALQMRWGNVAVVRWAAERVPAHFCRTENSIRSCRQPHFLRVKCFSPAQQLWPSCDQS